MPAESSTSFEAAESSTSANTIGTIKCSHCGDNSPLSTDSNLSGQAEGQGVVILDEEIERICASCWRTAQAQEGRDEQDGLDRNEAEEEERRRQVEVDIGSIGLGLRGMEMNERSGDENRRTSTTTTNYSQPVSIHIGAQPIPNTEFLANTYSGSQSYSLPSQHTRPWNTHPPNIKIPPIREETLFSPKAPYQEDRPYNPLLDTGKSRVSNLGRGALYPGSTFKGTQTSGRSAYDVEVRFLDVNVPESTVSGYLSISHLTDTHPHLTTFFTGEIIGPEYGFLTGPRYGATEHDDMRHWGRFEQFRRPATRGDMIRPELVFRDPVPRVGSREGIERDFVFLRIKERFLVPDHTVKDISGASFAGFYYAMVDLNPTSTSSEPLSPTSPSVPILPISPNGPPSGSSGSQYFPLVSPITPGFRRQSSTSTPTSIAAPPNLRRMSSSGPRSPGLDLSPTIISGGIAGRRRRESNGALGRIEREPQREATIRGYYFHSLNQEPFQELFLTHIPDRGSSIFEMR